MLFNSTPSVSVTEVTEKMGATGSMLIDVRSRAEYASGHAHGARNVPLDTLNASEISKLQQFSEVYVICQSGGRSAMATKALKAVGVNAINVSGGTSAWRTHGLPME